MTAGKNDRIVQKLIVANAMYEREVIQSILVK